MHFLYLSVAVAIYIRPMKKPFTFLLTMIIFLVTQLVSGQDEGRRLLRGQVLYRNSNVPNENVINSTAELATITDENGHFAIEVKLGDHLVFTSLIYQLEFIEVTRDILDRNRLVVEVNEKVTQLDEVVISPENQERFIQLKNEEFKTYEYETDPSSEVRNIALDPTVRGMEHGLNFVNIFKALSKLGTKNDTLDRERLQVSAVLRQVYDDRFFVDDLKIPQDRIEDFMLYIDDRTPAYYLLLKDNEFQLIEFLVTQSKSYLKQMDVRE
jgi:hypothetical protein